MSRLIDADKLNRKDVNCANVPMNFIDTAPTVKAIPIERLEQIRAEIDVARYIDKDTKLCKNANASGLEVAMQIINKAIKEQNE